MQILFFFFLFTSSSGKFPARLNSVDFKTREFFNSKTYFNKHTPTQASGSWIPDCLKWESSSWSCFRNLYVSDCGGERKEKNKSWKDALCFDVGKSLTWGTELWLNDGDKLNANLGLAPDNNKCGAKAFISISEFHLEIQAVSGNSFIRQLRQLMSVSTQLC